MATGLNVQDVVAVSISLSAVPAGYRNFGACLCLGPSPVIDITERIRQYSGIDGVGEDFANTDPEYLWAEEFFAQDPQPDLLYIGRFAQTATSAVLHGAALTPLQQLIANFNAITSGSMFVAVDGVPYALTGLNFSTATNLNAVASTIQTALQGAGATNAKVFWGGNNNRFDVISGTTGVASSVSYAKLPTAVGTYTFSSQPANNSTITLNGTLITFVTAAPTTGQVQIGATLGATLTALVTYLNASSDTQLVKFSASTDAVNHLYLSAVASGTGGNALTIATSNSPASNATVSGATLTGGSGIDVSILLGLSLTPNATGANADVPVPGAAAESALSCIELFGDAYGTWYAAAFATPANAQLAVSDHLAVAGYIESATQSRVYGVGTQNTTAYDDTRSDDIGSVLKAAGYSRTMTDFSSNSGYGIASLFGRFATVNYGGSNTCITLKFKQMPGIVAEYLGENQAATLKAKNYNVFVNYANGTAILQEGVMCNGNFIDSRINADWLANYAQTNVYDTLLDTETKVDQTDDGMNIITTVLTASLRQAVVNNYLAPGVWNTTGFGTLNYGDTLPLGFYIYAPPVASQSETDRAKRMSVPFQIAAKESGAVHSANIAITVNP